MYMLKPMHAQETLTLVEKRPRHKMTDYQLRRLEELYRADTHPTRSAKEALATEVGMNVKSVLIWFQNRRQDRSRKAKTIATPPLTRNIRPSPLEVKPIKFSKHTSPLARNAAARAKVVAAKGKPFPPVSSRVLAPSSKGTTLVLPQTTYQISPLKDAHSGLSQPPSHSRRSTSPDTPRSEKRSPDLWKHLPPTPPSRGRKSAQRPSSSPTRRESPLKPLGDASNLPQPGRPEKPTLEWACANSAARRKHGLAIYRDEDDSAGESTDVEDELVVARWIPAKSSYKSEVSALGKDIDKKLKAPKERRLVREVAIPQEYHALFPPDLVLGASLLLTLKHSADPDNSI
ncbi:transcription factor [Ganoderma sinense ZZ0214-1]|uniref:Transcription factor n=1 Tax=Ganoderma sinense ZZ0214-1 TaxID=1077348 RepID=A0A2G8SDU3_9APHY|nr:transcription factor [Ganoderma sinense ZZ0214-1]